jgi:hypothetical protein
MRARNHSGGGKQEVESGLKARGEGEGKILMKVGNEGRE